MVWSHAFAFGRFGYRTLTTVSCRVASLTWPRRVRWFKPWRTVARWRPPSTVSTRPRTTMQRRSTTTVDSCTSMKPPSLTTSDWGIRHSIFGTLYTWQTGIRDAANFMRPTSLEGGGKIFYLGFSVLTHAIKTNVKQSWFFSGTGRTRYTRTSQTSWSPSTPTRTSRNSTLQKQSSHTWEGQF